MKQRGTPEIVDALLTDLDSVEPVSFDLGTPEVSEVDAVRELVRMGPDIVPVLLERIGQGAPKKRTAYVVLALKQIGDTRALAPLLDLRTAYQARATKDEWDHAVIGQANLAIEQLRRRRSDERK